MSLRLVGAGSPPPIVASDVLDQGSATPPGHHVRSRSDDPNGVVSFVTRPYARDMRRRRAGAVAALGLISLGAMAPEASAKVWFRMSDHVLRVGKPVRLVVPGCENGCRITREYGAP